MSRIVSLIQIWTCGFWVGGKIYLGKEITNYANEAISGNNGFLQWSTPGVGVRREVRIADVYDETAGFRFEFH